MTDSTVRGGSVDRWYVRLLPPLWPGMPKLFGFLALGGLICGAGTLFFAFSGLGARFVDPCVRALPAARPILGLSGVLLIAQAAAILARYPRGLLVYTACMAYNYLFISGIAWYQRELSAYSLAASGFTTAVLVGYGYLNREWFHPRQDDAT